MKCVLRYTMADAVEGDRLRALFPERRKHWETYREDGTLVAIGPMEDPADGALSVFEHGRRHRPSSVSDSTDRYQPQDLPHFTRAGCRTRR